METAKKLNDKELEQVNGGAMPNPECGLTGENTLKAETELGKGKDMGSWKTMGELLDVNVGGICGKNDGKIENCYNSGSVTGEP